MLYNHGAFHEKLAIELERANRYGSRWRSSCWTWTLQGDQRPVRPHDGDRLLTLSLERLGRTCEKRTSRRGTEGTSSR